MYKSLAKTLFIGKKVIFLPSCHSTNDEAVYNLEKENFLEGTVVITNHQTAGKGQRGNQWESQPGENLTFSLILKPTFLSIVRQFDLNIIISLAIHDLLKKFNSQFSIKWPNDIYHNEKKIAGILIQNIVKQSMLSASVVGIGLNINQKVFSHPKAISLSQITGTTHDLPGLFNDLIMSMEKRYLELKSGKSSALLNEYLSNLYWFGEDHIYRDKEAFSGRIVGITKEGLLEIQTNNGIKKFSFKEVEFLS